MDDADRAQRDIENEEAMAQAKREAERPQPMPPSETCRNCGAPLPKDRLAAGYCDAECRDEFEHIVQRQRANR